ncbi:hypothetical protein BMS3Abin03_02740 [bacterium BMS3Abin03]|nr:hypothetical protein BMS3Abin03_02740 [bacterium BMS3Abin03]
MQNHRIILFDGVCNFCNFWVNFILKRDRRKIFKFAALQSRAGQDLLKKFNLATSGFDTFILITGEEYFTKSTAALKISKELKSIVKIIFPLIILPQSIRDLLYDLIAKNRYKLFGKRNTCRIPTEDERKKFLE